MQNILKKRANILGFVFVLFLTVGAMFSTPGHAATVEAAKAKTSANTAVLELVTEDIAFKSKLQGGVYRLTNLKTGAVIENITTDEDGIARVKNLALGEYEVEEVTAPDGYGINVPVVTFTIDSYKTHTILFEGLLLPDFSLEDEPWQPAYPWIGPESEHLYPDYFYNW